jgi:hypothetical protein
MDFSCDTLKVGFKAAQHSEMEMNQKGEEHTVEDMTVMDILKTVVNGYKETRGAIVQLGGIHGIRDLVTSAGEIASHAAELFRKYLEYTNTMPRGPLFDQRISNYPLPQFEKSVEDGRCVWCGYAEDVKHAHCGPPDDDLPPPREAPPEPWLGHWLEWAKQNPKEAITLVITFLNDATVDLREKRQQHWLRVDDAKKRFETGFFLHYDQEIWSLKNEETARANAKAEAEAAAAEAKEAPSWWWVSLSANLPLGNPADLDGF